MKNRSHRLAQMRTDKMQNSTGWFFSKSVFICVNLWPSLPAKVLPNRTPSRSVAVII